jgi:hypothetical protein
MLVTIPALLSLLGFAMRWTGGRGLSTSFRSPPTAGKVALQARRSEVKVQEWEWKRSNDGKGTA